MKTQAHAPMPWRVDGMDIVNKDGWIASVAQDGGDANAAFIVRAVNAHLDMLHLLKRIYIDMENRITTQMRIEIKQAIARAEGKQP
jgi:hypothetical protein